MKIRMLFRLLFPLAFVAFLLPSCTTTQSTKGDYTVNQSRAKKSTQARKNSIANQRKSIHQIPTSKLRSKNKHHSDTRTTDLSDATNQRASIVAYAKTFIGTKYRYGGRDQRSGFDCSGFTCHVMKKFGVPIPPTSSQQSGGGQKLNWKNAQPGDLIFFGAGRVNHVGIVTSNNGYDLHVIHSTSSQGVRIDEIAHHSYWRPRILGASNYLNLIESGWESYGEE